MAGLCAGLVCEGQVFPSTALAWVAVPQPHVAGSAERLALDKVRSVSLPCCSINPCFYSFRPGRGMLNL